MQRIHARLAVVTLAAAAVVAVGTAVSAQSDFGQKMPLRFTALAVNTSNVGPAGAGPVDITIKRWTTPSEQERFLSLFREKGAKALLSALQDAPVVGGISTPGSISYDLHYAAIQPLPDGGYSITIATDRPIGFWEATSQERTLDYPFMLIQMQVDKDGNGQGKLARAAKLTISNDVLVIENWANQPMMLNEVRLRK
jgi:hypothetical protein